MKILNWFNQLLPFQYKALAFGSLKGNEHLTISWQFLVAFNGSCFKNHLAVFNAKAVGRHLKNRNF